MLPKFEIGKIYKDKHNERLFKLLHITASKNLIGVYLDAGKLSEEPSTYYPSGHDLLVEYVEPSHIWIVVGSIQVEDGDMHRIFTSQDSARRYRDSLSALPYSPWVGLVKKYREIKED